MATKLGSSLYKQNVKDAVEQILVSFGIDLNQPDFQETPVRVAKMYEEFFSGVDKEYEVDDMLKKWFPTNNDQMIIVKDFNAYSICPHHLMPVTYDVAIGCIPNKRALGLSKFVRVTQTLARRPILQENLTQEIADKIQEYLDPKGVVVNLVGRHGCMMFRGVKELHSNTITSALTGVFSEDSSAKAEFFSLIR